MRTDILDYVLSESEDGVVLQDALKALGDSDKSRYREKLGNCLDLKNDPAVVYLAMKRCQEWGVEPYLKEIELIAEKARQKKLQEMARSSIKSL